MTLRERFNATWPGSGKKDSERDRDELEKNAARTLTDLEAPKEFA